MRRQGMALISAVTISLAGLIGGLAAPAFAAGQPANPYTGLGPMVAWVWTDGLTFDFSGSQDGIPFPAVPAALAQQWSKDPIDNPAPLEWYYNNVSKTDLGNSVFGAGVAYSSNLIAKMASENFSPSMVGGVNPSGMTSSTTSTPPSTSAGTTAPSKTTSPSSVVTHSTTPVTSTDPVTKQAVPTTSHSSAPASASAAPVSSASENTTPGTQPTKDSRSSAPSTAPHATASASPTTQQTAKASALAQPPGVKKETPVPVYHRIIHHDRTILAADATHHASTPSIPWVPVAAGIVAVGLIGSGGWWAWQRWGH